MSQKYSIARPKHHDVDILPIKPYINQISAILKKNAENHCTILDFSFELKIVNIKDFQTNLAIPNDTDELNGIGDFIKFVYRMPKPD